jgi:hypothetical protein
MSSNKNRKTKFAVAAAVGFLCAGGWWVVRQHHPADEVSSQAAPEGEQGLKPAGQQSTQQPIQKPALTVGSFEDIRAEADPALRDQKLAAWLEKLKAREIIATLESLRSGTVSDKDRELSAALLRKLTELDPEAAAVWATERAVGPDRQQLLNSVAVVWASKNLTDVIAWARALPENDKRETLVKIAYEAVATDVGQALKLASEGPNGPARDELISHVAAEWATKNPEQIAVWAKEIPDPRLKEQVLSRIAATWGDSNPAAAAELALKALPAGKNQDDAVVGIVQRWVQTQPADAAAWVERFPEGKLRDTAMTEVVKLWSDKNLTDAGHWINDLAPGPGRDAAVEAYIGKALSSDIAAAANWTLGIDEDSLRERQMQRVAEAWLAKDPFKARRWIQESDLADEVKLRLLSGAKVNGAE